MLGWIFIGIILFLAWWLNEKGWEEDRAPISYERHAEQSHGIVLWICIGLIALMLMGLCAR